MIVLQHCVGQIPNRFICLIYVGADAMPNEIGPKRCAPIRLVCVVLHRYSMGSSFEESYEKNKGFATRLVDTCRYQTYKHHLMQYHNCKTYVYSFATIGIARRAVSGVLPKTFVGILCHAMMYQRFDGHVGVQHQVPLHFTLVQAEQDSC